MNVSLSPNSIKELVMEICSELVHTDRTITGGRLYSALDTAEMLLQLTYCGIKKNRKGLPTEIKTVK